MCQKTLEKNIKNIKIETGKVEYKSIKYVTVTVCLVGFFCGDSVNRKPFEEWLLGNEIATIFQN